MKRYKRQLVKLMEWKHSKSYSLDKTFTQEELLSITAEDVRNYFSLKAFGRERPDDDSRPIYARSNTLYFMKKAISNYIPRKSMAWDPIRNEGNPTRSDLVNDLIKKVKRFEVRQEGVQSSARRPLEYKEYLNILKILRNESGWKKQRAMSTLTLQWQLIARIDDLMKLKYRDLGAHIQHDFALTCKMRWSKNITEEREAPEQILLGSLNPNMCVLLHLALYIEIQEVLSQTNNSEFLFGNPDEGHRVMRNMLNKIFSREAFAKASHGRLGTHSIRKGAATYASRCGLSKDFVNRRGRWRVRKMIVDTYISTTLPFPDASTAAALCGPSGPCKYVIKKGFAVSDACLLSVTQAVERLCGADMARVLAKPLIWACYEENDEIKSLIPEVLKNKIVSAVRLSGHNTRHNPIEKLGVRPVGDGAQLNFIVVPSNNSSEAGNVVDQHTASLTQHFAVLRRLEELNSSFIGEMDRLRSEISKTINAVDVSVKRIAIQPVVRRAVSNPTEPEATRPAVKLSQRPRDLYVLWHEYEFGVGGTKAAKYFTAAERGKNKFAYSRRKIFWDLIVALTRRGYTSNAAIDKVYEVYGQGQTVSYILLKLREDRKKGGNPAFGL